MQYYRFSTDNFVTKFVRKICKLVHCCYYERLEKAERDINTKRLTIEITNASSHSGGSAAKV